MNTNKNRNKDIVHTSHQCSWYGVLNETLDQTIDWVIEHWYLDLFETYPDVKKFLDTPQWKALLAKYNNNKHHVVVETSKTHTVSPKTIAYMKKAAMLLISAISITSCNRSVHQNSEIEKRLLQKNAVGIYSETLEEIKITDDNDMGKEKALYQKAFLHFEKAKALLLSLKQFPNEEINFGRFLPLMIKESRLIADAKSKNGALWYFQLKNIAIDEVNAFLEKHAIDTRWFTPKTNPSHNIMYWILYFLHTAEVLQLQYPNHQDLDDFVYASYNAGITRITTLLEVSGARSRDDFVDYVVDDAMWLSGKYTEIDWPYGPKVRDFFAGKDYSEDKKVIFQKDKLVLTRSKAQEFIRYVETINSIKQSIDKERATLLSETIVPIEEWATLFTTIQEMKKNWHLKLKDGTRLIWFCTDIALDNNMNPDCIKPKDTLVITQDMMKKFDYMDTNVYPYDVIEYNKTSKYFLEKIVKEKIRDASFQKNIIDKVPQFTSLKDISDREFYLMNSLIVFNTQNRIWWTTVTSKNVWIPSDAQYYIDFFTQSEKEVRKSDNNIDIDIEGDYSNASLESIWDELVYQWNFKESNMLTIEKKFKHIICRKQSEKKEKLTKPTNIILHSTAANIKDISWVKAHFFVSRNGEITKLTDNAGNFRQLNHAWFGLTGSGAVWSGDKNITYDAIGIEVEALGGEEWNAKEYVAVKKLISYLWWKYNIQKKDVLAHSQIAFSSVGRWRKQDPYLVNWEHLGMPNNYLLIDKDVANGKCPNMAQFVKELKNMGMTHAEIKYYLSGIDAGILIANKKQVKKMNAQDRKAWSTSSTILKEY